MKITVLGLWHLGCVTAACGAEHFQVAGLDLTGEHLNELREGRAPISEPGLDESLRAGLDSGRLWFTQDPAEACGGADILWVCEDTPVDENDMADVGAVMDRIVRCLVSLPEHALILVSAQLPAGTAARLAELPQTGGRVVAVSPENLRLGQAIKAFREPDRIICGVPDPNEPPGILRELFAPFSQNVIWMRPASAEMTKHAINGFLALSIAYMNEVASLCDAVGADAKEVERGLKSEARIGPRAYLAPGGAFAGGTLARDVQFMSSMNGQTEVIRSIKRSNDLHQDWEFDRLLLLLEETLRGRRIAILGLAYKAGTDTLRRSRAIELARKIMAEGGRVQLYDPTVKASAVEAELPGQRLCASLEQALMDADAAVICTGWPELLEADWEDMADDMAHPFILDANRLLADRLRPLGAMFGYYAVGGGL